MQQRSDLHCLLIVFIELRGEILNYDSGQVHCSEHMFKASVCRCRIHVLGSSKLSDPSQSLNRASVEYLLLCLCEPDVAVDRVFDEPPEGLVTQSFPVSRNATAIHCLSCP